ncbi:alpha/beta hydrolase [Bradyrhizobium sp. USDA 4474]
MALDHQGLAMTTTETVLLIGILFLALLVIGNIGFAKLAERRNPPIGKFLECDGVVLHYIDRGDPAAPCVVLLHGNGSMIQDFTISGLVDLLARSNRVVCFDRPGFGYSRRPRLRVWSAAAQAALLTKALDQIGVRDPVVLGHSWGAFVAIALAMRKDYPIRGLVLASGYYFPTGRLDVWLMSGPAIPVLGDLISYTVAPVISWAILPGALRKIFAPRSVPPTFKNEFPASLVLRPTQLRAGCGGKRTSHSDRSTIPSLLFGHGRRRANIPWNGGSGDRTQTSARFTSSTASVRSSPRPGCRTYGHLRRPRGHHGGRQFNNQIF